MGKEPRAYVRLHHMRFFLLTIKLSNDLEVKIRKLIKDHGHSVIDSAEHADYLVTCMKSPDRIARHVKHTTPVIHTDWFIKDAMNEDHLMKHTIDLKCKKRRIESSPPPAAVDKAEVIALSSEDEQQAFPRQVRSWDHLKETFAKHGCQVTPRMVIAGHRPVPTLKKEESYQTTTTGQSSSLEGFSDFNFSEADTTDEEKAEETVELGSQEAVEKLGVYACQQPCDWNPFNKAIVELLEFLEYARELQGDPMNSRSYRIAASSIRAHPKKIKSAAQAQKLYGIGQKTGRVIGDFLETGCVAEVEQLKKDPNFKVLDSFYNVHGAGAYTAREWHRKGYRTLEDVLANAKLSKDQKIGIKYYDDFRKKIPRAEVEEIWKSVVGILDAQFPGSQSTICGSYRRGKPESSDVDIIITHKDSSVTSNLLPRLLEILKKEKLLVEIITMGSECQLRDGDDEHLRPDQALCVWKQPNSTIFRRVDLVVSPYESYPVAILAWTGSKHFERSIRLYAKKVMNIKVSSHGFYSRATQRKIPVKSERHAFEILNLKWLEPTQRNC